MGWTDASFLLVLTLLAFLTIQVRRLGALSHRVEWAELWIRALIASQGERRMVMLSELVGPQFTKEAPSPSVVYVADSTCKSCRVALNVLVSRLAGTDIRLIVIGFGLDQWSEHLDSLSNKIPGRLTTHAVDPSKRAEMPGLPAVAVNRSGELIALTSLAGEQAVSAWLESAVPVIASLGMSSTSSLD